MNLPQLAHKQYGGKGQPLLILHGLFGSAQNWITIAKHLAISHDVFTLDARNHGDSFRAETHSLDDIVSDLRNFIQAKFSQPVILLGHSMGGLTALTYTLANPEMVKGLIVVDIAPRTYNSDYTQEFAAQKVDLSKCNSRADIDAAMRQFVPDNAMRKFLQTNIMTNADGNYAWQINIEPIEASENRTSFPQTSAKYLGPTLFIRGLRSDFITENDIPLIKKYFPNAVIADIAEGDHWLHYTAQKEFLAVVDKFLIESGAKT